MAKKNELLEILVNSDPTKLIRKIHDQLLHKGLSFKDSGKTLLYKKGEEPRAAIRVVPQKGRDLSLFSFPKSYWNNHEPILKLILERIDPKHVMPVDGRYGQKSAAQLEICPQTVEPISRLIDVVVSDRPHLAATPLQATEANSPEKKIQETFRVVRDTKIAKRVKEIHRHQCQICGISISLSGGTLYGEGHHLRPLGEPHNGPDVSENIICVCPNHHVQLDYGAIELRTECIRDRNLRPIAEEYLNYHNQVVVGAKAI